MVLNREGGTTRRHLNSNVIYIVSLWHGSISLRMLKLFLCRWFSCYSCWSTRYTLYRPMLRSWKKTVMKVWQCVSLIDSFRLSCLTSPHLRRVLFSSYVLPLFTWMYPIYPFFTDKQKIDLSHFYFTCLRRVMFCSKWNENFFAYALDEISLEDRFSRYWNRYLVALADSIDGELLFEKSNLNEFRKLAIRANTL